MEIRCLVSVDGLIEIWEQLKVRIPVNTEAIFTKSRSDIPSK